MSSWDFNRSKKKSHLPPPPQPPPLLLNLLHIYYGGETYSEITLLGLSLKCKIHASEPKNVSEIS